VDESGNQFQPINFGESKDKTGGKGWSACGGAMVRCGSSSKVFGSKLTLPFNGPREKGNHYEKR
jgi:hypothetical protein